MRTGGEELKSGEASTQPELEQAGYQLRSNTSYLPILLLSHLFLASY